MSYTKHHTEAIVLKLYDSGEAHRRYVLLTKDMGRVMATAQGVRHAKSKLRGTLQVLSHARVSLVRGKHIWRITNATLLTDTYYILRHDIHRVQVSARIGALLLRLLHDEADHPEIFNELLHGYTLLAQTEYDPKTVRLLEQTIVLRLLHHLGYIGDRDIWADVVEGTITNDMLADSVHRERHMVHAINQALEASQM